MKAVSLWQPWASAIPFGLKRIETRGWQTHYRGPLAIHAAKRWTRDQIKAAGDKGLLNGPRLPRGQVIATATLHSIYPSELLTVCVSPLERSWGDYDPERFGWLLVDIRPCVPFDFKGAQGFFNVPDELIRYAA